MNAYDHSGKVVPSWSGCPYLPPLGRWLGFHQSPDMHEAHHNKSVCSFGLLNATDRVFGTARYASDPKGTPSPRRSRLRMAIAWCWFAALAYRRAGLLGTLGI